MRFLQRLKNLLRGRAHAVLEEMEKPREQLSVVIDELQEQVRNLHRAVADAISDEKRIRIDIEDHLAKANEWDSRALLALQAGNEDLARQALAKKDEHESRSIALHAPWESQRAAVAKLKDALNVARGRVEETKRKYTLLVARHQSAKTRYELETVLSPKGDTGVAQIIEALEEKIRRIEAETEAQIEISGESTTIDLEKEFTDLEKRMRGDDALRTLRARLDASRGGEQFHLPVSSVDPIEEIKSKLRER